MNNAFNNHWPVISSSPTNVSNQVDVSVSSQKPWEESKSITKWGQIKELFSCAALVLWRWEVNHGSGLSAHHWDNEADRPGWLTVGTGGVKPAKIPSPRSALSTQSPWLLMKAQFKEKRGRGWRVWWGHLVATVDKTQFEKPVEGNDCFWPPSCYTARAVYCAVC